MLKLRIFVLKNVAYISYRFEKFDAATINYWSISLNTSYETRNCKLYDSKILNHHPLLVTSQAKDKGNPPMNSSTTLEVMVLDTNDNPPVFTQPVYTAPVPENAFGGFQVYYSTF